MLSEKADGKMAKAGLMPNPTTKERVTMKNITPHGIKHLETYLRDYKEGRIDGGEVKALLACCFSNRRYGDRND